MQESPEVTLQTLILYLALLEKGYSPTDIKKIYGGNLLRVMRAVEQHATQLKSTPPILTQCTK